MADARETSWDRPDLALRMTSPDSWEPQRLADDLAMAVALHLAERRRTRLASVRTSIHRPDPGPEEIRVPHLVLVGGTLVVELAAAGAEVLLDELPWRLSDPAAGKIVGDTVVWEVMPFDTAASWLGTVPSANLRTFVDANTRQLLGLKRASRRRNPSSIPAVRRLRPLLGSEGHLSIEFVYRHEELLRQLLDSNHPLNRAWRRPQAEVPNRPRW